MSGHNKWSQIKRTKGASDAKKSQVFGKLARMISAQVKVAGGDRNAVLVRSAIEKARSADMPVDTIERAISKATEQKDLETIVYEAYGPAGVGIIIEAFTDSRNRAAQEIRHILDKNGFALGGIGSVMWNFQKVDGELQPKTTVALSNEDSKLLENLIDELEENNEVQEVITNAE
ncbi:MAG: YebC/PmpR family DNA-binding transcriptional regulator [Candidatus Pacebacteria bacterium]|nr:YebC/PmpR family DNA-binding transcriptional regulator [Candidatus Paceibacterota bacterium]